MDYKLGRWVLNRRGSASSGAVALIAITMREQLDKRYTETGHGGVTIFSFFYQPSFGYAKAKKMKKRFYFDICNFLRAISLLDWAVSSSGSKYRALSQASAASRYRSSFIKTSPFIIHAYSFFGSNAIA